MSNDVASAFDCARFREVMGHYPTGVAVVTGRAPDGELLAMVVGTFSSVSLDPPLVSFMPMRTSRTFERLRECSQLCINIVGGEQEQLVGALARRWENKLDGVEWFPSPSGLPVLEASIAWIETSVTEIIAAGDHWIVLCAVNEVEVTSPAPPLIFLQGGYGTFVGTSLVARLDHEMAPVAEAVAALRPSVERLAKQIGCEARVFTTVGEGEMAAVLSSAAPGVSRGSSLARRIPLIPPLGDSVYYNRDDAEQQCWLDRLGAAAPEVLERNRARLEFLRTHGYVLAFLPDEGEGAYESVFEATRAYDTRHLTPAQERRITETIASAPIDYTPREVDENRTYDIASVVVPMRDGTGRTTLTLRLSHLPAASSGATVWRWVQLAIQVAARGPAEVGAPT